MAAEAGDAIAQDPTEAPLHVNANASTNEDSPRGRHPTVHEGKHMYFGKYVSSEGSKNLLTYQYHGEDYSIIYNKILGPFDNWLVEFLPRWIAPNVITLTGLLIVTVSHAMMYYYCPDFEGEAPRWLYVFAAFALFAYQTLDNLDGKQARRTGTSSPLGLLFDHGCDAINTTVGTLTVACVLQLGPTWKTLAFHMTGHIAFFCATWEEYYSGSLTLPIINGPTEGILFGVFLKLFTAFVGPQFWLQEYFTGMQNNTLFMIILASASIPTIIGNFINVFKAVRERNDSMLVALTRLLPHIIINVMAVMWALLSPGDVFMAHPRQFIWVVGLLDCKLVLHLMLAHLCGEEFHPFRKTLVPIFYVAAHCAYSVYSGMYEHINEGLLLQEFFFLAVTAYIHIVISVVYEVKTVLHIPVFTVPKEKQHPKTT